MHKTTAKGGLACADLIGDTGAMDTSLILCVDGGGSGSRARLVDANGKTIANATAGPCNPTTDLGAAAAAIAKLWCETARQADIDPAATSGHHLTIGAAGLVMPEARAAFANALPAFSSTTIVTDGYAALIGAGGGRPCCLIAMGTGAVGHKLMNDGRSVQRDGWSWLGGDRGSGAWIGRRAIEYALMARDGVVASGEMAKAVDGKIGKSEGVVLAFLARLTPERAANLAPLVIGASEAGDPAAIDILQRAGAHAAALVRSLDPAPDDPVYLVGGLADVLKDRIETLISREFDTPQGDSLNGCFLIATNQAPDEVRAVPSENT
ncbi:MAG TPA: BadF/BadG/BcrA/BcrD ATPase family protein [Afifellaceae bacterium]|nr:BadF/BadG/BcrA/BcrD ATPase family protein [Afifellaceae bacterium]